MQHREQLEYIYVLELHEGHFYVGKTRDIVRRFKEHKSQKGSAWTKQHGGCKIIEIYESTSIFDEDKYTLEYMNMMGVNNVRGGSYSNCVLSTDQQHNITRALRNANNLCTTCGESDHFSDMCSLSAFKADKKREEVDNTNNPDIKYVSSSGVVHNNVERTGDFCDRCKRNNHNSHKCWAKTDLYGNVL